MIFFSFWKFGHSNSVDLVGEATENHLVWFFFFITITGSSLWLLNLGFPLATAVFLPTRNAFSGFIARMQVHVV